MERKEFIKTCGLACLAASFGGLMLEGCASIKPVTGELVENSLVVPLAAIEPPNKPPRQYVVVQHEKLRFPICVYRFSETQYTTLLMRCTHQGAELQVFGDRLQCPAHGSTFSNKGLVQTGPADTNLRSFPVTILKDQLRITLS
ncbi:MAG: Rieske (2Fe-2S) protein [Mucilaginibacter sp.]|nr:Rieske (2Fe-2S) protein [Mucilaginibacter sp.]